MIFPSLSLAKDIKNYDILKNGDSIASFLFADILLSQLS